MLRDITLGQYYPTDSPIHRLDPRTKLFSSLLFIIYLFVANNIYGFIACTLYLAVLVKLCHVPFSFMIKGLRAIMVLLIIAAGFNIFLTPGEPIVSYGIIKITSLGVRNALLMIFRMTYLIIGTSVLTLTTSPNRLTAGLERGLGFLSVFRVPVHEIAMMITIAMRFIPLLMEEADRLMNAQLARGADFESGNIIKKAKGLLPILVPLFVSAFRRASDLALAMEARCYNGGSGRTKLNPLKYKGADYLAYIISILMFVLVLTLRIVF